ncbi:hypothetical protein [Kribbella sp. NPDC049227]|uniref:hypothetical protein n=1 Tax=Kribbella sp. NPDC049227 TaxID=3364113 RepID=UPI00371355D1
MKNDHQVIEALQGVQLEDGGLEGGLVLRSAQRRRAVRIAVAGIASAAVGVAAATAVVAAAGIGGAAAPNGVQVAGSGDPSGGPSPVISSTKQMTVDVRKWTPGGVIGAKPLGTIPAMGKVKVSDGYWFETKGTTWCVTESGGGNPFGCRGTVGNANIGDSTAPSMQTNGDKARGTVIITSVFRNDDARRVIYGDKGTGKFYEGKVYRLEGVPGWTLSVGVLPWRDSTRATAYQNEAFVYNASGDLIFPVRKGGHPIADPLHSR